MREKGREKRKREIKEEREEGGRVKKVKARKRCFCTARVICRICRWNIISYCPHQHPESLFCFAYLLCPLLPSLNIIVEKIIYFRLENVKPLFFSFILSVHICVVWYFSRTLLCVLSYYSQQTNTENQFICNKPPTEDKSPSSRNKKSATDIHSLYSDDAIECSIYCLLAVAPQSNLCSGPVVRIKPPLSLCMAAESA